MVDVKLESASSSEKKVEIKEKSRLVSSFDNVLNFMNIDS